MKHTPGPWAVEDINGVPHVYAKGREEAVARIVSGDADARLIAAAPELLEALKKVQKHNRLALNAFGRFRRVQPGTKTADKHWADYERHSDIADEIADAAIARAIGA